MKSLELNVYNIRLQAVLLHYEMVYNRISIGLYVYKQMKLIHSLTQKMSNSNNYSNELRVY